MKDKNNRINRWISPISLVFIIAAVLAGAVIFDEALYSYISMAVALASFVPLIFSFESKNQGTQRLVIIAVMTALSVAGRILFAFAPSFKPVSAFTIITGTYMGKEAGFVSGALAALISNFYFGQGPWTPFQMLSFGLTGFAAGCFRGWLERNRTSLYIFGALCGLFYSFLMDIWTVLWADKCFNLSRYFAAVATAAPITAVYAFSNVFFLVILAKPFGQIFDRLHKKYGFE